MATWVSLDVLILMAFPVEVTLQQITSRMQCAGRHLSPPKRSGKLTLTLKTVNSAFFLVVLRVVRRHVDCVIRRS